MFNRKQYKNFARQQLKGRWTVPVLMTLIIVVISCLFEIPDCLRIFSGPDFQALLNYTGDSLEEVMALSESVNSNSTSILTTIIQVIVSGILEVAAINVYIKMSRSPEPVSLKGFIEGLNNWARALLGALWQLLWVFLWSLLFLIPGIVKAYAYSQMFFIITEYKDVSVTKAMRISMLITKGHKWDLFVMDLSFLGWAILCGLTLGIGALWLEPYMNMSKVNAYHAMLKEALESGLLKPEDLTE